MGKRSTLGEDDVARIRELHAQGWGRNRIGDYLNVNPSTVKCVLDDSRKIVSDRLSVRQRQDLLNSAFRPCQ